MERAYHLYPSNHVQNHLIHKKILIFVIKENKLLLIHPINRFNKYHIMMIIYKNRKMNQNYSMILLCGWQTHLIIEPKFQKHKLKVTKITLWIYKINKCKKYFKRVSNRLKIHKKVSIFSNFIKYYKLYFMKKIIDEAKN